MRALLLSDIHANLPALEAVLAAAPPHDVVWNLGDIVGYGANPNEAIATAQRLGGLIVRGNHDRACSGSSSLEDFSEHAALAARWTQSVLTEDNRAWLARLPTGPLQTLHTSLVHGSPRDEDEYIVFAEDAAGALQASPTRITFFGHTHLQGGFATNGEELFHLAPRYETFSEPEHYELPLRKGASYLLNPGSVGQPRDGDWRAAFALYDDASALLTWHRIPYDVADAQERIRSAFLPTWLADRLQIGR